MINSRELELYSQARSVSCIRGRNFDDVLQKVANRKWLSTAQTMQWRDGNLFDLQIITCDMIRRADALITIENRTVGTVEMRPGVVLSYLGGGTIDEYCKKASIFMCRESPMEILFPASLNYSYYIVLGGGLFSNYVWFSGDMYDKPCGALYYD